MTAPPDVPPHGKYARIEIERRFLLASFPRDVQVIRTRHITDRYIDGTRLRLRQMLDDDGPPVFKLTQKIPVPAADFQQGYITNIYLDETEFQVFARLPAATLTKTRYSVPPFGIDVFAGALEGLVLAEAEFDTQSDALALSLPSYIVRDVSTDTRFTGGHLVRMSRAELQALLADAERS